MRRSSLLTTALTVGLAIVLPAAALAGSPAGASVRPGTASAAATSAVQCRTGTIHPTGDLTASGKLCVRYAGGQWVGSGSVTLTARKPVTGTMSFGPRHYPERPSGYVGVKDFTVEPGHPLTVPLDGTGPAEAGDTGTRWEVWIGVPHNTTATGIEGMPASPVVGKTSVATGPRRNTRTMPWRCTVRPITGDTLTGRARLCVRQVRSGVQVGGTLTYTAKKIVDVHVGTAHDGDLGEADTTIPVPASAKARTVVLPAAASQVLLRDGSAAAYLRITSVYPLPAAVPSAPLRLR